MVHKEHNITDVALYRNIGCKLADDMGLGMIMGLVNETGGKPCTTGCSDFKNGQCTGYKKLLEERKMLDEC